MSAIASINLRGEVAMLTDGAVYGPDGKLTEIRRKVTISDRVPLAVATRGDMAFGKFAADFIVELVEQHGFDLAMRVLDDVLEDFGSDAALEVVIAGVSEEHGPRHMSFFNRPNFGRPPFELRHPGTTCFMTNNGDPQSWAEVGVRPPGASEKPGSYFAETGRGWLEHYRHRKEFSKSKPEWGAFYTLGGQIDLTVVDASRVTVRTIHRWAEDKIGEQINPVATSKTVVPITAGMNRQQRRQAEREARKARAA